MKKTISVILAAILLLAFVSCNGGKDETSNDTTDEISTESFVSEETTEETTEESDISTEVSEEKSDSNMMFNVESPQKATITNEHKGKIIISYHEGKYSVSSSYSNNAETSLAMKQGAADQIGTFAFKPEFKSTVESPKELDFYGLDSDENAAAVIKVEGYEFRRYIRIGNKTEGGYFAACDDGSGNYDSTVYVVGEVAGLATKPIEYFVDGVYGVKNLRVSDIFYRTNRIWIESPEEKLAFSYLTPEERAKHSVADAWKLTEPEEYYAEGEDYTLCKSTYLSELIYALCNIKSENVLVALPEEEDLAKYGLDKPYRYYSAQIYASSLQIYMTKPDENGNMYIGGERVDGGGDVYYTTYFPISVINEKDFHYVNATVYDFIDNRLLTRPLKDVVSMTLDMNGESHFIEFAVNETHGYIYSIIDGVAEDKGYGSEIYTSCFSSTLIVSKYTDPLPEKYDVKATVDYGDETVVLEFKYSEDDQNGVCLVNGEKAYNVQNHYFTPSDIFEFFLNNEMIPE